MAQRYRERTPQTGDIADPRDLMENLSTLVGEFNGGLDADNLPDRSITSAMVLQSAFTILVSQKGTNNPTFNGGTTEWRSTDDSSPALTISEQTITCNTDAILEVEWSASWSRTGASAADYDDDHAAAFRLLVDGAEIARLMRSPRARHHDQTYLVGTAPVQGGQHRITVEIRQWVFDSDKAHGKTTVINERELIVRAYKR